MPPDGLENGVTDMVTLLAMACGARNDRRTPAVVADMIGEIAAKTNLLALNATIEAARGRCRQGLRRGRQRGGDYP